MLKSKFLLCKKLKRVYWQGSKGLQFCNWKISEPKRDSKYSECYTKIRNLDGSHMSCFKAACADKFARKQMCPQMAHQEAAGKPKFCKGCQAKGQDTRACGRGWACPGTRTWQSIALPEFTVCQGQCPERSSCNSRACEISILRELRQKDSASP